MKIWVACAGCGESLEYVVQEQDVWDDEIHPPEDYLCGACWNKEQRWATQDWYH